MNKDNLNIASRLFAVATALDLKGFDKIASDIDKVAEDWLGTPDDFMESMRGTVETLDYGVGGEVVDRYDKNRDARHGEIRPAGDEFSYNYLPEEDKFIVSQAPPEFYSARGAKFGPEHAAYKKLENYLGEDFASMKKEKDSPPTELSSLSQPLDSLFAEVARRPGIGNSGAKQMFAEAERQLGNANANGTLPRPSAVRILVNLLFTPREIDIYLDARSDIPKRSAESAPQTRTNSPIVAE